ncbi:MAG: LysM peptidoglycan-binding domain-containing protein [Balneolaceae bacterium]
MKNTCTILYRHILCSIIFFAATSVTLSAQQKSTYEIQQGETLYSISKKLNVTIAELTQWNSLNSNNISVGQQLVYFENKESAETIESPPEPSGSLISTSSSADNTSYVVKSGDNLYSISREHNMTLEQLKGLNNLENDNISVGQKLAVKKVSVAPSVSMFAAESSPQGIFTVYKIEQSESLNDILIRFKLTTEEFEALNPEIDITALNRGQEVTILLPPSRNYSNPYLQKANLQDLGEVAAIMYNTSELGKSTTNGELYDPNALTAAHSNIALGSIIFVENQATGKGVYVQVNDRITGAGLKLSSHAFRTLGLDQNTQPAVTIYTDS